MPPGHCKRPGKQQRKPRGTKLPVMHQRCTPKMHPLARLPSHPNPPSAKRYFFAARSYSPPRVLNVDMPGQAAEVRWATNVIG